ncbi:PREDICTED: anaphase-promoting complex subunit 1-like [Dinoponera quadriceps]|uniref:Anaphase-promoting complex subunit 1-like n=1 Tax=Dinoponera quadriceps TaxID=609295 RepID=A0A6P3WV68_DINQU|nr:PREDICTED: anaphase-promoting complex subunit 1-like [Dinoponera quadriceps]
MIAASEPVEYIPGGRQIISRHPGSLINQQLSNNRTAGGENILLKRFSEVNISEKSPKEKWLVRDNKACGEEELYYSGKVAVHCKGNQTTRILKATYTCETDIKHALWCKFHTSIPDHMTKGKEYEDERSIGKSIECVCLLDTYTLKVFTESGEDYISTLQFQVSAVWPTKYGIILEKCQVLPPVTESRYVSFESSRLPSQNENNLPIAFSLMHPLDEICPLLIKHGSVSYMSDSNQQIIFTSSEPSLAVVYDTKSGLHSVYKIRKALAEECQMVCGTNETTLSLLNHSTNASPLNLGGNLSANKSLVNKGHLSIFGGAANLQINNIGNIGLGLSNTPFGSRTASYNTTCSGGPSPSQQQQQSRSQSSMATISRCQSPTHSALSPLLGAPTNPSIYNNRLHQTVMVTALNQTQNIGSPMGSYNSIQLKDVAVVGKPLYPEICLDHVWTESSGVSKDIVYGRASKVLLTSDLVGQSYLGYLVPNRSQFFLVRLEKTNKQQRIIFGMVTSITAKDAVSLPNLNMVATVDLSNNIVLYTGVTCVGKLHISGMLSNLAGNNYFLSNSVPKSESPFPRRSSLISQSCTASHEIKFEEVLHSLSPVGGNCARPPILLENSLLDASLDTLKEAVGNQLTVECGNRQYFRITLPISSTSPLVTKCLHTLRSVLQKDLAMELLVKWYGARNAPGPQDFSPAREWGLFLVVLFTLSGYDVEKLHIIRNNEKDQFADRNSPMVLPKKQKTSNCGSTDDWLHLLNSSEYKNSQASILNVLKNRKISGFFRTTPGDTVEPSSAGRINAQAVLFPHLPLVLFSLHLLYEELKLNSVVSESLPLLGQLLYQLSIDLKFEMYAHHYFLDSPSLYYLRSQTSQISDADLQKITIPSYIPRKPPDMFETMDNMLNGIGTVTYPYLSHVNPRTRNLIYIMALVANENRTGDAVEMERYIKLIVPAGSRIDPQESGKSDKEMLKRSEKPVADKIILLYHEMDMTKQDLETLPPAVSLIMRDVMHRCRECPPSNWPMRAYELIDRQDLAALDRHLKPAKSRQYVDGETKNYTVKDPEQDDGMGFDDTILKLRFSKDHRVTEVRRLLNSSKPVRIAIVQRSNVSDHEFIEEQERHLHTLCTRTMALPVARGMFTLRTSTPMITEQLPIPRLCLTGKAPPRGTTVELAHIDVPPNMNLWPLFHNGVAAGLCIHPDAANIDSTWIVYNKQQQGEYGVEHSGFLMGLGLNGHLKNLAPLSTYEYLVDCHEATSVGLLLGLSATHRGTMNVSMTKLLSLHVETLLPPTSIELNVQQNVQVAALMGVGLVYQGTAHRHISHALLSEIGRPPGPEMKNCVDRESYSLTAGLALGLVILGSGGGTDLPASIPDTLHYYMVGGHVRPFSGAQKDKYKSPRYIIIQARMACFPFFAKLMNACEKKGRFFRRKMETVSWLSKLNILQSVLRRVWYHLQALRHLYVLAAEPRVILPKDIDTNQYCYATIHLTFETEREAEGQEVSLQAPCLLPQLCSLKKVELKDSRYWKIIFEKHHNWQKLENMLERRDFLSIKQRAGCLSYLEDPHGFRTLMAQTLTTENVIAWAARPEYVTAFTNDKTVLNIITYFLQWPRKEVHSENIKHSSQNDMQGKMPEFERYFLHVFAIILYECITKDKVSLIPLWLHIMKNLKVIEEQPNSFSMWQVKLVSSQISKMMNSVDKADPLLSAESMLAIKQKTAIILDKWEQDLKPLLKQYLISGMVQADVETLHRMCAYLVFYRIPYPIDDKISSLILRAQSSSIPNITLYKLRNILQST